MYMYVQYHDHAEDGDGAGALEVGGEQGGVQLESDEEQVQQQACSIHGAGHTAGIISLHRLDSRA